MKIKTGLLPLLFVMIGSTVVAKSIKPFTLVNNSKGLIQITFGYNQPMMESFWITMWPTAKLKINWDVDLPMNIFICDGANPDHRQSRGETDFNSHTGEMYILPVGESLDLQYSTANGLKSNSNALLNRYIIKAPDIYKFKYITDESRGHFWQIVDEQRAYDREKNMEAFKRIQNHINKWFNY